MQNACYIAQHRCLCNQELLAKNTDNLKLVDVFAEN